MIRVYHVSRRAFRLVCFGNLDGVRKAWLAGEYRLVAEVDTDEPEVAWRRTNTTDRLWWTLQGVTLCSTPNQRSTSVGDVIVLNDKVLMAASLGFQETDLEPPADSKP